MSAILYRKSGRARVAISNRPESYLEYEQSIHCSVKIKFLLIDAFLWKYATEILQSANQESSPLLRNIAAPVPTRTEESSAVTT